MDENEIEKIPNAETLEAFEELDSGGGYSFHGTTEEFIKMILEEDDQSE